MLITSRVLQGLLGAVMLPQGLGMIKEMFPPKEMAAAFGAFGPVMGLSAVGGPILAGWLVSADYFDCGLAHDLPDQPAARPRRRDRRGRSSCRARVGNHATKLDLRGVAHHVAPRRS